MARPRQLKSPARVNLLVEEEIKNAMILMAAEKGLSVGQLISQMVQGETAKAARRIRGNGHSISPGPSNYHATSQINSRTPVHAT